MRLSRFTLALLPFHAFSKNVILLRDNALDHTQFRPASHIMVRTLWTQRQNRRVAFPGSDFCRNLGMYCNTQFHYKITTTENKNEETNSPCPTHPFPPNLLFHKRKRPLRARQASVCRSKFPRGRRRRPSGVLTITLPDQRRVHFKNRRNKPNSFLRLFRLSACRPMPSANFVGQNSPAVAAGDQVGF